MIPHSGNENEARRGSALVVVLLMVIALAGITAALISTSLFRFGAARGLHEGNRAYHAATTGLSLAIYEMQEGTDLSGDAVGAATGTVPGGGDYVVQITPPFGGPGEYTLSASGRFGSSGRGLTVVVSADRFFGFGIFARDGIVMNGGFRVDSFDPTLGSYASQVFGDHAGDNGSLGSNWNIVANADTVYGDANPGPGYQVLGDPTDVTGSTAPALFPRTTREVPYTPPIPSAGDLIGSQNLASGIYRYDNMSLDSGALTINGDVELYVDEDVKLTGDARLQLNPGATLTIRHGSGTFMLAGIGAVNKDGVAANLTIVSSTTESIKIAGSADFYGSIYAPEAALDIVGDTDVYGAFVAAEADLNGSGMLHFDESLLIPDGVSPMFTLVSAFPSAP